MPTAQEPIEESGPLLVDFAAIHDVSLPVVESASKLGLTSGARLKAGEQWLNIGSDNH